MTVHRFLAAAAGLLACACATAADLEPAMGVRLSFDGRGVYPAHLGLRLDYANHGLLAREEASAVRLPAAMEWAVEGQAARLAVYSNGIPVAMGPRLRVSQAEQAAAAEEESLWDSWGWNTGTILLAAGAGIALITMAAGDAAADNNPAVNPGPNDDPSGPNVCVVGPVICVP